MAETMPILPVPPKAVLKRELNSFLGAGHSFFNSLFSPEPTKGNGKPSPPKPTQLAGQTTPPAVQTTPPATQTTAVIPPATSSIPSPVTKETTAFEPTSAATAQTTPIIPAAGSSSGGLSTATPSLVNSITESKFSTSVESPLSALNQATSTALTGSSSSAASSGSSNHTSKAGPVAAGVTIALVLSFSIAMLVFFYVRRRRSTQRRTWKRLSRSASLLSASSDELDVSCRADLKEISLPSRPSPSALDVITPRLKSFNGDAISTLESLSTHSRLSFQKPTVIYVGPAVKEREHQRLPSIETVSDFTDIDDIDPGFDMTSKPQTELPLPSVLIAGRQPTSAPIVTAISKCDRDAQEMHQNTNPSQVRPGPGQSFTRAGPEESSTLSEHQVLERKAVPEGIGRAKLRVVANS